MCKVGDIILVNKYKHGNKELSRHSFVVLSTEGGSVRGLDYDLICNVMSSFKDEEQKKRKLAYPGNLEVAHDGTNVPSGNTKGGYIKAEQFYYFDKDSIDYMVIGNVTIELFTALMRLIDELDEIEEITDNLTKPSDNT